MFRFYLIFNLFISMFVIKIPEAFCQNQPYGIGEGQCIWYDQCAKNPEKDFKLNCRYDGPAKELPATSVKLLRDTCPELIEEILDTYGNVRTCCSSKQVQAVAEQLLTLNSVLHRCPACISNLRKNFCYFTCHPRQSAFLNPTLLYKNDSIWRVNQYSSDTYINAAFESCKSVYFPPITGPALGVICGKWGADECTPERLFDYFGNNFLAPFNITYTYGNENTTAPNIDDPSQSHPIFPFNVETNPCNSLDGNYTCRCVDCKESCTDDPPQPKAPETYHYVGDMRVYVFVFIMIFCVFSVCLIAIAIVIGLPGKEEEEIKICICNQELSAKFENKLSDTFQFISKHVAYHPYIVAIVAIVLIVVMSCGILFLDMTTNPVELWASPESRTRKEKDYFDQHFGPFYRTNQIILTSEGFSSFNYKGFDVGPVFNDTFLREVFKMQDDIFSLTAEYDGKTVTLEDVCIKPLAPQNNFCLIQSVYNYFQNDLSLFDEMVNNGEYLDHLIQCMRNPSYITENTTCMGTYGGPVFPYVAVGGFLPENATIASDPEYEIATALVISILNQNYDDKDKLGPARAWEKKYLDYLKDYSNPMMDIAYTSERSIQDEIERESKSDVSTILISYFVMFAYVAISLGNFNSDLGQLFIETKMTLGLCSVVLVFLSVVSSIGFCGYIGVQGTLFVLEVIPFLVLAVGVDNIFLLVQTLQREQRLEDETVEEHVARVVGKVAPSMLIATSSEVVCFFLGALSDMPAVYSFSLFAGVALAIDFLLQITCLVAFIVIDAKRKENNRYDILCCVQKKKGKGKNETKPREDLCMTFFKHFYAPFLFSDIVRVVVIIVFVGGFIASCCYIPKMDIGLEQQIGMPDDSYVIKYFDFMALYLSVGAPVYFVIKEGFNFPDPEEQNIICQSLGCNPDSILAQIFYASEAPDVTSIATGANSWIDDYFSWISDGVGNPIKRKQACCRLDSQNHFINSSAPTDDRTRRTCLRKENLESYGRPSPEYFMEYLPDFLIDNPHGTSCPEAGHPSYGSSVIIKNEGCKIPEGETTYGSSCVGATNFMSYNTILKDSRDFTNALQNAYDLTDQLNEYIRQNSATPDVEIFPYSIFYVFYEQYLDMWPTVALSLSVSLISVFVVMLVVTGFDMRSCLVNVLIIIMIIVDIMGLMVPWNIQLNAISLVNLVMAIGISVEFCSHLSHAFSLCPYDTKVERASYSLIYTGSSVLSGITLTKFAGIIILAFASSQVITVFYFRMYLMIVLLGAAHGLIFLPVILSLIGPPTNPYVRIVFQNLVKNNMHMAKYDNPAFIHW